MKIMKKIGVLLLSICLIAGFFPNVAHAASGSVKVSSASNNVGQTVTVTCTVSLSEADIGGADVTLQYDPSAISVKGCSSGANGGSGSVYFSAAADDEGKSSLSFTVTFEILKEGSHEVSVTYADVYDWEFAESIPTSKSSGVVKGEAVTTPEEPEQPSEPEEPSEPERPNEQNKPEEPSQPEQPNEQNRPEEPSEPGEPEKDKNSKLKSMQVYPGTLKPVFDANTTSYTVETTSDVTEVTISAVASSDKAKVSVSGGTDLKVGDNAAKVVVTAENGNVTVYNLNIICGEVETIEVAGSVYTVDEEFSESVVPEGFVKSEVTYNGKVYFGAVNENKSLALMCLKGAEKSMFFVYDQDNESFSDFIVLKIGEGKVVYPLPVAEKPDTYNAYETELLKIGEKEVMTWKLDDEFSVVRTVLIDGTEVLYRYDHVDGTYQRYVEQVAEVPEQEEPPVEEIPQEIPEEIPEENTNFFETNYFYIMIGLGAVCVIFLVVIICLLATRKTKRGRGKARERRKARKQKKREK